MPRWIADPTDAAADDFRSLTDMELRSRLEPAHGLFIAEGEKVIRRALGAGYRPRGFLLEQRWYDPLADVLEPAERSGVPVLIADQDLLQRIAGYRIHRGALASLARRPLLSIAELLMGAHRIAVLEDIVDHTNVGAILRNAAALGIDAAVLSPRCADPLYRRSIKVSMGAVFALPWTRVDDWYQAMPALVNAGFTTLALTPSADAENLADLAAWAAAATPPPRLAIMVGTEGSGLSRRWLTTADRQVRIEMSAGIDSLNVAAASAVAFWALGDGCRPVRTLTP